MASMCLHVILGLLMLAGCSLADRITCEINQNPVVARRRHAVSLPCHFDDRGKSELQLSVSWQVELGTEPTVVVHAQNGTAVRTEEQDKRFQKRTAMFPSWYRTGDATLQITPVKQEDSGNYTCYIRGDGPAKTCAKVELTVNSAENFQHCGYLTAWIMILLLTLAKLLT